MAEEGNNGIEGDGGAPERPDYIPEQFWDKDKGEPDIEGLALDRNTLAERVAKGKESSRQAVIDELMADRPEKPTDYALAVPEEGDIAKAIEENNLVFLTEKPGEDFEAEAGKAYFMLNDEHPLIPFWRDFVHEKGGSQEDFMKGIVAFAQATARPVPSADDIEAARQPTYDALGQNGKERFDFARNKLIGLIGEDLASNIWHPDDAPTKEGVEAVEKLLEAAGAPAFKPSGDGSGGKSSNDELLAKADKIMAQSGYYNDPAAQKEVAEIYAKVYPPPAA